jgi:hypothetical protein
MRCGAGNIHGEGAVREKELYASCRVLGIPATSVTVLNDRCGARRTRLTRLTRLTADRLTLSLAHRPRPGFKTGNMNIHLGRLPKAGSSSAA